MKTITLRLVPERAPQASRQTLRAELEATRRARAQARDEEAYERLDGELLPQAVAIVRASGQRRFITI